MNKSANFYDKCYHVLSLVPKGKVTTYKELASAINSKAYRAIGTAMSTNPNAPKVPCHRVVKSTGEIGQYAYGTSKKIALLKKEGLSIKNNKIQDFSSSIITGRELKKLAKKK